MYANFLYEDNATQLDTKFVLSPLERGKKIDQSRLPPWIDKKKQGDVDAGGDPKFPVAM